MVVYFLMWLPYFDIPLLLKLGRWVILEELGFKKKQTNNFEYVCFDTLNGNKSNGERGLRTDILQLLCCLTGVVKVFLAWVF